MNWILILILAGYREPSTIVAKFETKAVCEQAAEKILDSKMKYWSRTHSKMILSKRTVRTKFLEWSAVCVKNH